jgi:hypothetical protein
LRRIGIFRDLESRVRFEDDAEAPIAASEEAHPQVLGTPVAGVTRSPCTASGSQTEHVQSDGAQTSGSQSVETSPEAITLGQRDLTCPLTTSGKRRPRWFQETLKEAKENVGEPKSQFRLQREQATNQIGSIFGTSDEYQGY